MSNRTLLRYLAIQSTGWLFVAALALGAWHWAGLPAWVCIAAFAAWIGKDLALYPSLRPAYESVSRDVASDQLVGVRGVVTEELDPEGWVRVQGTLWRATAAPGAGSLEKGRRVRVESVAGMRLVVRSDDPENVPPPPRSG